MSKKYLMISFEDPKIKKLSEVLGNNTCKRILDFLSEKEASKTEISKVLKIPLNTIEYNVNKLTEAGLIEKSKDYFWSTKGKKIGIYKISNKSIVISPKNQNKIKNILTLIGLSGLTALFIGILSKPKEEIIYKSMEAGEDAASAFSGEEVLLTATPETANIIIMLSSQPWFWFLIGALGIGIIFLILNWKKL